MKILKRYSYKWQPKDFKLVLKFPPNGPHKIMLGILEILSFRLLTIFFRKSQIHHYDCSLWRNKKLQLYKKTSYRRAKRSEISDLCIVS